MGGRMGHWRCAPLGPLMSIGSRRAEGSKSSGTLRLSIMATKVRSTLVFVALDASVVLVAYGLAEVASLPYRAPDHYWPKLLLFLAVALAVQLTANRLFGLYGRIWRHAGFEEARNIAAACFATLATLLALYPFGFAADVTRVPFEVLPLGCLLTMLGIGVLRFHSRLLGWQRANRGMGLRVGWWGAAMQVRLSSDRCFATPAVGCSPLPYSTTTTARTASH